jgi:hypothetical protein
MAAVFEGLMSSRRRPARSQSESGKQLHARWGDASISAPNSGGWNQHYLDEDNVVYQANGSPDSQKTLVNTSPDLSLKDGIEKISIDEVRQPTPPLIHKERGAITITIPLLWSRKSHRRSSSASRNLIQPVVTTAPETIITAESRPVLPQLSASIDELIVAESRPVAEPLRAMSPILQTQSPVYDDISTFFTRVAFPEKHPGPRGLPQIQTQVPINKSQPASALSLLSPVAEKYDNGMSESNNATPIDNTPIAERTATAISSQADGIFEVSTLAGRLENYARKTPSLPPSRVASPIEGPSDRPSSRTARLQSRASSRGPGIGETAYMRASSRDAVHRSDGHRSVSRDALDRRPASVEPARRRTPSRDVSRRRADSPRAIGGHSYSRETGNRSVEPRSFRAQSRDPAPAPGPIQSQENRLGRHLSMEPVRPRAESPGPGTRRAQSRTPPMHRDLSPPPLVRRAASRDPVSRRRMSMEVAKRAASIDPIHWRGSPLHTTVTRHTPPLSELRPKLPELDSSSGDDATSDETTDIETETDEMYFESRKGWNGAATVGASSNGFYAGVMDDYKLIARDVEADQIQVQGSGARPPLVEIVNLIKKEKPDVEVDVEPRKYGGPDLVPCHEELWG